MNERFRRYLWASTATHVGVILVAVIVSLVMHVRRRQKPHEITTFIDVQAALPDAGALEPVEQISVPEPPAPEPPKPIPEPAKRKIEKSTKRVKREPAPRPKPALTPEELKRMLASGLKPSDQPQRGATDAAAWYLALVRQTMYDAWTQPSDMVGRSPVTTASIRVLRDGTISEREIVRASGHSVMDESVMKALQSVTRLKPLPPEYPGSYRDITIVFELTGALL